MLLTGNNPLSKTLSPEPSLLSVFAKATTALKILTEARAGRLQADIFDGLYNMIALQRAGLLAPYRPPNADQYPQALRDADGFWIAILIYVFAPGINTNLVAAGEAPTSLRDLLDPKWRGKMAWNALPSASGGLGFVGTVLTEMGETDGMAYLRAFSKQKVANVAAAAREVLDQVIAGEYAIGLQIFNHHAVISAKKGAPVDWIKMEPVTGTLSVLSVHKNAPHPNAAKLLADFIISPQGQQIFRAAEYLSADPAVPALTPSLEPDEGKFRARFFTPEQTEDTMPAWKKIHDDLFR